MRLVLTWVCDTCAMAAGTLLGGPRLAPVLSPRKTWAGAIGGTVGALAAALLYGPLVLDRVAMQLGSLQLVTMGAAGHPGPPNGGRGRAARQRPGARPCRSVA